MPPGSSPVCVWCQATSTTMWHRLPNNQIVCQICYAKRNLQNTGDSPTDTSTNKRNTNSGATNSGKGNSRDKGNGGSGRTRSQGQTKTSLLSRRGRRSLKKRKVIYHKFNVIAAILNLPMMSASFSFMPYMCCTYMYAYYTRNHITKHRNNLSLC